MDSEDINLHRFAVGQLSEFQRNPLLVPPPFFSVFSSGMVDEFTTHYGGDMTEELRATFPGYLCASGKL